MILIILFFCILPMYGITEVNTYFPQTDHELVIHHIKGQESGKTLMIIGGIHGDELAAYEVSSQYQDLALKKGNLILVPRANMPAIMANKRFLSVDMNRRFDGSIPNGAYIPRGTNNYEDEVTEILKRYMQKSDLILNLHEGSGFYRHTWESDNKNPMKYGQSVIADTDSFLVASRQTYINLKKIAEAVITEVNNKIDTEEYKFRFNNHNTISKETQHVEQRKSATYFALTQLNIPAFGVEISKLLPSQAIKNEHTKLVINAFLNYLDIRKDTPTLIDQTPTLNYILAKVNGEKRYYEPSDTITLPENSTLQIMGISSNFSYGNIVDVLGLGNKNDINKIFTISRNTEIVVSKDYTTMATIPVRISSTGSAFEGFRVSIINDNQLAQSLNKNFNVFAGDTLKVAEGTEFEIIGSLNNNRNISISIAGATPRIRQGKQIIDTGTRLNEQFAINKEKNLYEIIIKEKNKTIANSFLQITPLEAYGLHISHNGKYIVMSPGDTLYTKYDDILYIHDVELNNVNSSKVKINFAGYILDPNKDAEDRGGNIILNSKGLIPRFATNPEKTMYEIHVLYKQKRYGTYFVKVEK